jgi:hypothetical protein
MSAVGYPEYNSRTDPFNRTPKYCTQCRKLLESWEGPDEYDAFTGNPIHRGRLVCPTLEGQHDDWVMGNYGEWSNNRLTAKRGV